MSDSRPIAIDLFAGAGGLSLGLEQAGFDVVAAVEIDPIHSCVHQYNFPNCALLPHPIERISGHQIRQAAGLDRSQPIDLVAGGAPCQGFSLMGQRALDDPRNHLIRDYIRIIQELQPSYFLFENVKGITLGKHQIFLEEIIAELEDLGYRLVLPWQILNAKDYGVPQNRERLFLMGTKQGHRPPHYPPPFPGHPVTCQAALGDLPDAEAYEILLHTDEVAYEHCDSFSDYASLMRCANDAAWRLGYRRLWDEGRLTSSRRTVHSARSRRRFLETPPGQVEKISRFFKLSADGVSNTLRAGTDASRGAFTSPRPIHYRYPRCVTVREMARLHGFPDWFRFHATKWHGARQIGNAVPPPLAYALGRAIIAAMDVPLDPPEAILALGDDGLLRMDMQAASAYWGVNNPIAGRDRNSGQKKQRPGEIGSKPLPA
ncbi:MAG: DNA cytosine methyltransferase [Leptolyngbya sp.]|nr:DNA cytosine methyltransferase [Leptolyngbya sp.]